MKRLIIILLIVISFYSFGLELSDGRMKIVFDSNNGSFSVFYLDNINSGKFIPLLFDKDPETSFLSISTDNKILKMGSTSGFSQKIYSSSNGGTIVWSSKELIITESFAFIKSKESALSDGFSITVDVENLSDKSSNIGIGYLFDTFMGEEQNAHFLLDSGVSITSEASYSSQFPNYWISPSSDTGIKGLQGMVRGPGITVPDKIIFANWKRLQNNLWNYQVKTSRNFNLIPYSINDSAVAMIFDPIRVDSKSSRSVTIVMGGYTGSTFQAGSSENDSDISNIFESAISTETDPQNVESSLRSDLLAINDLIKKIDVLLEYPDNVTDAEVELIEQILDTLEQRKKLYEDR